MINVDLFLLYIVICIEILKTGRANMINEIACRPACFNIIVDYKETFSCSRLYFGGFYVAINRKAFL